MKSPAFTREAVFNAPFLDSLAGKRTANSCLHVLKTKEYRPPPWWQCVKPNRKRAPVAVTAHDVWKLSCVQILPCVSGGFQPSILSDLFGSPFPRADFRRLSRLFVTNLLSNSGQTGRGNAANNHAGNEENDVHRQHGQNKSEYVSPR